MCHGAPAQTTRLPFGTVLAQTGHLSKPSLGPEKLVMTFEKTEPLGFFAGDVGSFSGAAATTFGAFGGGGGGGTGRRTKEAVRGCDINVVRECCEILTIMHEKPQDQRDNDA